MKTTKFTSLLVLLLISFGLVSCSDSDKDIDPNESSYFIGAKSVFSGKLPLKMGIATLQYDSKGFLTKVISEEQTTIFTYPTASTPNVKITMTVSEGTNVEDNYILEFELGKNGFASKALQTYADKSTQTWEFGYNKDHQLNYMKRSEGGNETTTITYTDGNITAVKMEGDDKEEGIYINMMEYISSKHKKSIDNKANIMLFDVTFGIDMDEMEIAYYAGLLGRSTKSLPLKRTESYVGEDDKYIILYDWTLDTNGYPTKLSSPEEEEDNDIAFVW